MHYVSTLSHIIREDVSLVTVSLIDLRSLVSYPRLFWNHLSAGCLQPRLVHLVLRGLGQVDRERTDGVCDLLPGRVGEHDVKQRLGVVLKMHYTGQV